MKRYVTMAVLIALAAYSVAEARVKVSGRGAKMNFSADSIPEMYKPLF